MHLRLAPLAFLLMAISQKATADHTGTPEPIVIKFRNGYAVCTGLCPNFRTELRSNGVIVTQHDGFRATRFRVSRKEISDFSRSLETIRPIGTRKLDQACEQATLPNGARDPLSMYEPDDIDVIWIGAHRTSRLTACLRNRQAHDFIAKALRAVGVDPGSGFRVNRKGEAIQVLPF